MSGSTKERPILFSGPMVRAILDGRKTVTRRLVTSMRGIGRVIEVREGSRGYAVACRDSQHRVHDIAYHNACDRSPFGVQGDRLWLRERFAPVDSTGHKCAIRDANFVVLSDGAQVYRDGTVFAALPKYAQGAFDGIIWRPSIHMPRWASRILLEVVSVRVERLHAITEEDAQREGADRVNGHPERGALVGKGPSHREGFAQLWEDINGKRGPWSSNPWVWRVEFRRVA